LRIVIDANIFCGDYYLRGSNFRVLLDGLTLLPGTLAVPEVVIDEVVNRYREDLEELILKERDTRAAVSKLLSDPKQAQPLTIDVSNQTQSYREYLESSINRVGKILPYPNIAHKKIVERDLARRKPFKRDGSGYRDFLLWETLRSQMLWGSERIVFLTNNPKDFGEGPLVDLDLQPDIINPQHLQLIRSVREFNETFIHPRLRMLEGFKAEATGEDSTGVEVVGWLRTNLIEILYSEELLGPAIAGFPDGVGSVTPIELVAFHDLKVDDARELDSGGKLIRLTLKAEIEFSVDVDWDDYVNHSEVRDWAGEGSAPFSFSVSHHVEEVEVTLDLVLDRTTHAIDSHELIALEGPCGSFDLT
jgi:predicted nucleic acid-binding protein